LPRLEVFGEQRDTAWINRMSKLIKQMEMDALQQEFQGIRDLVIMSVSGVDSQADNQLRLGLRRKNIRLKVVKNSLARRVFDQLGMHLAQCWEGQTTLAWGSGSLAELSRELDGQLRKNAKVKFKGAVADGQEVSFEQALKMPTRVEAIGRVVMLALAPASRLLSQIRGPGSAIASQIKALREKEEEALAEGATAVAR
jgi:large subunit ribosomal protein L10